MNTNTMATTTLYRLLFSNGSGRRYEASDDADAMAKAARLAAAARKPRYSVRELHTSRLVGRKG